MTRLVDADAREKIAAELDRTMAVEAAAGTGKTTSLVTRIVNVLGSGRTTVDRIVAVTFTEKAAGELKLRLRSGLEQARRADGVDPDRRRNLEQALSRLEEAHVNTIHGFCSDLLRERPLEAGIDPRFEMLDEPGSTRLFDGVFNAWFQEMLAEPAEGVRRMLRRPLGGEQEGETAVGALRNAAWELSQWRDFRTPWRRDPFDRDARMDALAREIEAVAQLTAAPSNRNDNLFRDTDPVRRFRRALAMKEEAVGRDHDGLEADIAALARSWRDRRKGYGSGYKKGVDRATVLDAVDHLREELARFMEAAEADLAALLQRELLVVVDRYQDAKEQSGRLDFLDLLIRARDLVVESAAARTLFQERITHLFVDEFQDTDPIQAELLLLLAADDPAETDWRKIRPVEGKLFLVGDPKQSIYRFRRADVGIYRDVVERLRACGALCVELSTNFRSSAPIQRAVNRAFAPLMTDDEASLQAPYVPLAPARLEAPEHPAVVALAIPRPLGKVGNVTNAAIDACLPDTVAAYVHWLIRDSGWTVTEREAPDTRVPVQARHICILFRKFLGYTGDLALPYARALEAREVPHLLVGGRSFHEREEVEAMTTALSAVEWADDELSVFGTLRGPFFGIDDATLFAWRQRVGRFHPYRTPKEEVPEGLEKVARALAFLRELNARRNRRSASDTVFHLLDHCRAHVMLALRPSGEQALANVFYLGELARQFEASGGLSFRAFVEQLREKTVSQKAGEAPILEEGSDGVRIMSVHKAKGLEFPVVILADLTTNLARRNAERWTDPERGLAAVSLAWLKPAELVDNEALELSRQNAEGVRLAYVAATRARDLLVIPAAGDGPRDRSWFAPLNGALFPPEEDRKTPKPIPGGPPHGRDTVLDRKEIRPSGTVLSGLYTMTEREDGGDGYDLAWWDPASLTLDAGSGGGLRRDDLISREAPDTIVEAGLADYKAWKMTHDETVAAGQAPSLRVATVGARAKGVPADAGDLPMFSGFEEAGLVAVIEMEQEAGRSRGRRFGALVHAVLAAVPLDAGRDLIEERTETLARVLGADDREVRSAVRAVTDALAHAALDAARAAMARGACRRETPIQFVDEDGTVVEGVVDLAYEEEGGWVVIDFKTDAEPGTIPAYRNQLALYVRGLKKALDRPVRAVLMQV